MDHGPGGSYTREFRRRLRDTCCWGVAPGTREYLACETGLVELRVAGQLFRLRPGDVVVFRGDQQHSYRNAGDVDAVAYAVVAIAPTPG